MKEKVLSLVQGIIKASARENKTLTVASANCELTTPTEMLLSEGSISLKQYLKECISWWGKYSKVHPLFVQKHESLKFYYNLKDDSVEAQWTDLWNDDNHLPLFGLGSIGDYGSSSVGSTIAPTILLPMGVS